MTHAEQNTHQIPFHFLCFCCTYLNYFLGPIEGPTVTRSLASVASRMALPLGSLIWVEKASDHALPLDIYEGRLPLLRSTGAKRMSKGVSLLVPRLRTEPSQRPSMGRMLSADTQIRQDRAFVYTSKWGTSCYKYYVYAEPESESAVSELA